MNLNNSKMINIYFFILKVIYFKLIRLITPATILYFVNKYFLKIKRTVK